MNEVWMRIFNAWVDTYHAIDQLQCNLIEDEQACELRCKLLDDIIETFKSEVEE